MSKKGRGNAMEEWFLELNIIKQVLVCMHEGEIEPSPNNMQRKKLENIKKCSNIG